MKRFTTSLTAAVLMTAAVFGLNSCIYEAPGDNFYRTLWTSSEEPLGKITLEFLCGKQISVKSPDAAGTFGTYESDGYWAWFEGLTLTYDGTTVYILEARRSDDLLHLTWFTDSDSTPHTTLMHRLSAYE